MLICNDYFWLMCRMWDKEQLGVDYSGLVVDREDMLVEYQTKLSQHQLNNYELQFGLTRNFICTPIVT